VKRFSYICADAGIPIPGSKGASIHVASVCRALLQAGLEGSVYTPRREEPTLAGVPVHVIAAPGSNGKSTIPRNLECDFIYERYSLWHQGGLERARDLGVPFILEVNSPLPEEARRYRKLADPERAEAIAGTLMREADGVVCVSREVADWVAKLRGHRDGVWIVPNGVDTDLFAPGPARRPTPLPPSGVPLAVFCGSFRPWHGVDDLIHAFGSVVADHVNDAHLVCVGDGPLRESFEETARALGIASNVHVTGAIPHDDVPRWLRGADIAVAPYPRLNGFYFSPLKIFEFLSLELPVVAADVGQVREIVPDGVRGSLYSPGDREGLTLAMAGLLRDGSRRKRLGKAGRDWVLENATWAKRVTAILERIESL